jgi:hypothetical protein
MEIAWAEVDGSDLRARGTQIGVAYELRYEVEPGHLKVEVVGGPSLDLSLEGTDFFDLGSRRSSTRCRCWAASSGPRISS